MSVIKKFGTKGATAPMICHSSKSIFPFLSLSASATSSSKCDTTDVSIYTFRHSPFNHIARNTDDNPHTVAQSPIAYTSPSGAPLTRRCASTSIAFLCTWFGSRLDTYTGLLASETSEEDQQEFNIPAP